MKYLAILILFALCLSITSCSSKKSMSSSPKRDASPKKSEPVPGAEILIEQEPTEIPNK